MKTHSLLQGSPEWLAYRAQHFNASDAPAMMGCSAYKTRTQLLHEMHTGLTPDVDASTQRLFDDGHRSEALARPLAEAIIGEELYPVTGSEGKLSASFDGLTMDEGTNFEHKRLNNNLRAIMVDGCSGADLDMMYQIQMEQQHMVSGASRTLFMASEWDGEKLVEERHCWYQSNPELRAAILQGWTQFAIDLENYTPTATEAKPIGRSPETLPALHIEVTGMVTASNLAEYKAHALAVFAGINRDLVTDQDFASAESTVKWCGDIEQRLAAAKQHALSQTASIDDLFKTIDDISAEARATRLELDKLVKNRKDTIRLEIVRTGKDSYDAHILSLNQRIGRPIMSSASRNIPEPDFASAIKGKRTLDSMRDAVNTELARVKIAANEMADTITLNLRAIDDAGDFAFLFADVATLALKEPEFVAMAIKNRIADHQAAEAAKEAATRERIRAEEQAKAEKAVREAKEAEDALVRSFESNARRIEHDSVPYIEKALTAYKSTAKDWADDPRPRIATAYADGLQYLLGRLDIAQQREVAAKSSADAIAKAQTVEAAKPVTVITAVPETNVQIVTAVAARVAPTQTTPPTLALGEISTRLGFNVTSAFLASLGFEATTVKAAKLFHDEDFPAICRALIEHIESVCELQAA